MEFISARLNYELVTIKQFVYPSSFEFEFLGDTLEGIPTELLVEIVGSRKPILFCEGTKAEIDCKVYESLFGAKYTVIPTGNCLTVEKSTVLCNLHASVYNVQSAIGIIDSDLKDESQIKELKKKGIYALYCNEIEMFLIDEYLFKKVLERVFIKEDTFVTFQNSFFKKLEERKEHIIKRKVKTIIDNRFRSSCIDDKKNNSIEEIKKNMQDIVNDINVEELWQKFEEELVSVIKGKDYEKAKQFCCLEHKEVIPGLTNPIVSNYLEIALGILREDRCASSYLREKYFPDIDMQLKLEA